ncbi:TlpA family protein disulfide reductase [Pseudodesulfovibrio sp. zrk46]|nr:TlpA family protein disulfide reductase [Pseudodesulfovibrio sp. zrk46]
MLFALALMMFATAAVAGDTFPDMKLSGKLSDAQKAYLGVTADSFNVSEIKGDYLFVEAYSMYCPICQRDAAEVNEMYAAMASVDPKSTVKFVGLAMGNTPFEVEFYRKKYEVEFPLFQDEDYSVHKALKEVGTPAFYIVKLDTLEILFMSEGELKDKDALMETLKANTNLQ